MHFGRAPALLLFAFVVVSYTVQTELSQFVQSHRFKGYVKPYFLLWLTHSGYFLLAPLHLLALKVARIPLAPLRSKVQAAFVDQFANHHHPAPFRLTPIFERADELCGIPAWPFVKLVLSLTVFIALPALSWYTAVPLTSMTDVTAIYNSNAFWAYVLSIYLAHTEKWQLQKAVAVILACLGVAVIAYGDSGAAESEPADQPGIAGRLLGNLFALAGSILFGFYEVYYQTHAALEAASITSERAAPKPTVSRRASRRVLLQKTDEDGAPATGLYEIAPTQEEDSPTEVLSPKSPFNDGLADAEVLGRPIYLNEDGTLDVQTFLAHANTITSSIGIATIALLWLPIPLLHFTGIEVFELPPDFVCWLAILGNVLGGVFFNAAFMLSIALYGSVLAAVGALFTVVSVTLADVVFGKASLTLASLAGSGLIIGGFTVLAHEAFRASH